MTGGEKVPAALCKPQKASIGSETCVPSSVARGIGRGTLDDLVYTAARSPPREGGRERSRREIERERGREDEREKGPSHHSSLCPEFRKTADKFGGWMDSG